MIITAWDIPAEDYITAQEVGINTIWGARFGDVLVPGLSSISKPPDPLQCLAFDMGDDIPVSRLPEVERQARELESTNPGTAFCALVPATYTRLLDHLEVKSYEEYLDKFFELAPSLRPMLCHYPARDNDPMAPRGWRQDYWDNLRMVSTRAAQVDRPWWVWIQVTGHKLYEWEHRDLERWGVALQALSALELGATGFGFFGWNDIEGHPGLKRHPWTVGGLIRRLEQA